jgi:hypothetical protein
MIQEVTVFVMMRIIMIRIPRLHIQRWINPWANKARAYDIKRQGASQKSGHKASLDLKINIVE